MHPPKSKETWIHSDNFTYLSDQQIFQFKGGPLKIANNGLVLEATEDWQFLRVFANHRVVLSPGAWNMVGILEAPVDRSN